MKKLAKQFICPHCKKDIRIRNPSGYCDHLKYPEYCKICEELELNLDGTTVCKHIKRNWCVNCEDWWLADWCRTHQDPLEKCIKCGELFEFDE